MQLWCDRLPRCDELVARPHARHPYKAGSPAGYTVTEGGTDNSTEADRSMIPMNGVVTEFNTWSSFPKCQEGKEDTESSKDVATDNVLEARSRDECAILESRR